MEKLNLTQKITVLHHKKKHKKINTGLVASYDIQPGNGDGLFWFWRFINLSLTYLDTYTQPQDPHGALDQVYPKVFQGLPFLSSNHQQSIKYTVK